MEQKTFGEVVKIAAKKKGVSLYKLALKTGRNPGSIYKMLSDSRMRTTIFIEYMEALETDVNIKVGTKSFKLINNNKS